MHNKMLKGAAPDVSVIIVSWNARKFLLDCLKSLRNGNGIEKSIEIIVVDNASTDGSPEAVRKIYPCVKLICNEANRGFAAANNIGIEQSSGRYICLINSDIEVLGNCLEKLCDYMDSHPATGMLGPKILNADMTLQSSCRRFPSLWNNFCVAAGLNKIFRDTELFSGEHMFFFKHDKVSRVNVLVGCFLIVRREALEQVGNLDNRFFIYSEDIDWCKRFWTSGWEVVFFPDAHAIHFRGGSSSNAPTRFAVEQDRASIQYWKKHHTLPQQFAIKFIMTTHHTLRVVAGILFLLMRPSNKTEAVRKITSHSVCLFSLLFPRKVHLSQ